MSAYTPHDDLLTHGDRVRDAVRRLQRAARWVQVNTCVTLNVYLQAPGRPELAVPCIEGMTTVSELLDVARYYEPDLPIVCLQRAVDKQTLSPSRLVSDFASHDEVLLVKVRDDAGDARSGTGEGSIGGEAGEDVVVEEAGHEPRPDGGFGSRTVDEAELEAVLAADASDHTRRAADIVDDDVWSAVFEASSPQDMEDGSGDPSSKSPVTAALAKDQDGPPQQRGRRRAALGALQEEQQRCVRASGSVGSLLAALQNAQGVAVVASKVPLHSVRESRSRETERERTAGAQKLKTIPQRDASVSVSPPLAVPADTDGGIWDSAELLSPNAARAALSQLEQRKVQAASRTDSSSVSGEDATSESPPLEADPPSQLAMASKNTRDSNDGGSSVEQTSPRSGSGEGGNGDAAGSPSARSVGRQPRQALRVSPPILPAKAGSPARLRSPRATSPIQTGTPPSGEASSSAAAAALGSDARETGGEPEAALATQDSGNKPAALMSPDATSRPALKGPALKTPGSASQRRKEIRRRSLAEPLTPADVDDMVELLTRHDHDVKLVGHAFEVAKASPARKSSPKGAAAAASSGIDSSEAGEADGSDSSSSDTEQGDAPNAQTRAEDAAQRDTGSSGVATTAPASRSGGDDATRSDRGNASCASAQPVGAADRPRVRSPSPVQSLQTRTGTTAKDTTQEESASPTRSPAKADGRSSVSPHTPPLGGPRRKTVLKRRASKTRSSPTLTISAAEGSPASPLRSPLRARPDVTTAAAAAAAAASSAAAAAAAVAATAEEESRMLRRRKGSSATDLAKATAAAERSADIGRRATAAAAVARERAERLAAAMTRAMSTGSPAGSPDCGPLFRSSSVGQASGSSGGEDAATNKHPSPRDAAPAAVTRQAFVPAKRRPQRSGAAGRVRPRSAMTASRKAAISSSGANGRRYASFGRGRRASTQSDSQRRTAPRAAPASGVGPPLHTSVPTGPSSPTKEKRHSRQRPASASVSRSTLKSSSKGRASTALVHADVADSARAGQVSGAQSSAATSGVSSGDGANLTSALESAVAIAFAARPTRSGSSTLSTGLDARVAHSVAPSDRMPGRASSHASPAGPVYDDPVAAVAAMANRRSAGQRVHAGAPVSLGPGKRPSSTTIHRIGPDGSLMDVGELYPSSQPQQQGGLGQRERKAKQPGHVPHAGRGGRMIKRASATAATAAAGAAAVAHGYRVSSTGSPAGPSLFSGPAHVPSAAPGVAPPPPTRFAVSRYPIGRGSAAGRARR